MRTCPRCLVEQDPDKDFGIDLHRVDGKRSCCRRCDAASNKRYREKVKAAHLARMAEGR
jgi:hypothetical protein